MTEPSAALILASKIEARAWTGTEEFAFNQAEGHMIITALRAAPASEPIESRLRHSVKYVLDHDEHLSQMAIDELTLALDDAAPAPQAVKFACTTCGGDRVINEREGQPDIPCPECAGEAVSPDASPPVHEAIGSDPWPPTNVVAVTQSAPAVPLSGLAEVLERVKAGIGELKDREHYIPHHFHLACQALTHMAKGAVKP